MALPLIHGGPDGGPEIRFDFSTNANALGPLPAVLDAINAASRRHYPDPAYTALRQLLGDWHGVDAARVLPAGSAGEFIWRITQWQALAQRSQGRALRVWTATQAYGEYAAAARAVAAQVLHWPLASRLPPDLQAGDLCWLTEPHSPSGTSLLPDLPVWLDAAERAGATLVLDLAYQPLRLDARHDSPLLDAASCSAWQLWSPNKACGLTGVRGAYAIAPVGAVEPAAALRAHAPSWVLGIEGQAMLEAFCGAAAQQELSAHRNKLAVLRDQMEAALTQRGWQWSAGVTPFALVRAPVAVEQAPLWLADLRSAGVKLRDATSFGLPGWARINAQPAPAQAALYEAWDTWGAKQ